MPALLTWKYGTLVPSREVAKCCCTSRPSALKKAGKAFSGVEPNTRPAMSSSTLVRNKDVGRAYPEIVAKISSLSSLCTAPRDTSSRPMPASCPLFTHSPSLYCQNTNLIFTSCSTVTIKKFSVPVESSMDSFSVGAKRTVRESRSPAKNLSILIARRVPCAKVLPATVHSFLSLNMKESLKVETVMSSGTLTSFQSPWCSQWYWEV
mmetsp:Transcript_36721/g.88241  ORF Transcript_36721/g.88241 Transcript_36721/m.88241 type:complete len:207 (-) Transcript_36721:642-1262(-)